MKTLDEKETLTYMGGGKIAAGVALLISGVISFLVGVYSGYTNPKACNAR